MKLSAAQQKTLAAIADGNVAFFPCGHYYRRRDVRGGVRLDTMAALINKGLVARPQPAIGKYSAVDVEITDAGRATLPSPRTDQTETEAPDAR